MSSPDLGPRSWPWPPRPRPLTDGIGWCLGSPPSAFSCCYFCCPWYLGQGPRFLSPLIRDCMCVSSLTPLHPPSLPIFTQFRAGPSFAIGLQPPSPENPSVTVALLAVFAFLPIVTEARARRHPVQTIAVVLLPILGPFRQCFSPLTMSGQSTSFVASLRLLLLIILRIFKMVSLKPLRQS